jgi:hypothetical protein
MCRACRGIRVLLVIRRGDLYCPSSHASPKRRCVAVTPLRLVLATWAVAIYVVYWLGYLRIGS